MAELDFISKYTGLQIEEILDYAYRNQYKVSLDIVAEPKTTATGPIHYDGGTPYVKISGLPSDIPVEQIKIKLFRRGVFHRGYRREGPSGHVIENFKSSGWIHPRHGDTLVKQAGSFIPPYRAGENKERRIILSEFIPASPTGGMIKPYPHTNILDNNFLNYWSYILGGYGEVDFTPDGSQIGLIYHIGKYRWSKGVTFLKGRDKCVFSKPLRGRFAMAVFYQETQISPMIPFDVSISINSRENDKDLVNTKISINLI